MLHTKLSQPNDLKLFGVEVEGVTSVRLKIE